ncbi:unnamed protein product [Oppiella nova]|uniref:Uncharacterized protein n=1 Tax=Oppiella nova TaxID=334625 RepID=A0A7R9M7E3_9ACAR|nr:unnamed protein product [Oppiella nova]CAG2171879.1 unnamed protein product [Oppiella nova]
MCYATSFIRVQAFIYRTLVKCHQLFTSNTSTHYMNTTNTSHISCLFHQMSIVVVFLSSANISMASPIRSESSQKQSSNGSPPSSSSSRSRLSMSSSPKWINPCRLPTHPINPDKDFAGAPPVPVKELLRNVMSRAKVARNHGQQVKEIFRIV